MALKLKDMIHCKSISMIVEDEHGQEQVFIRSWFTDEDDPMQEHVMWLQGNPFGYEYRKLTQEEADKVSGVLYKQAEQFLKKQTEREDAIDELLQEAELNGAKVMRMECNSKEEAEQLIKKLAEMLGGEKQ